VVWLVAFAVVGSLIVVADVVGVSRMRQFVQRVQIDSYGVRRAEGLVLYEVVARGDVFCMPVEQ
jgi:hypothetical protein